MQVGEYQFYRDQLWTAPELLRMTTRPINGTQKADVYSFAIIMQEIMFRAEPYFIDIDPPQCMLLLIALDLRYVLHSRNSKRCWASAITFFTVRSRACQWFLKFGLSINPVLLKTCYICFLC